MGMRWKAGRRMTFDHENIITNIQMKQYAITRRIGQHITTALSEIGLTRAQFHILNYIGSSDRCRATDIANMMEVKPSAVTLMIDRLEAHQWVRRSQDAFDRRVVVIELTEEGKNILSKAKKISEEVLKHYLSNLSQDDLIRLLEIYEKLERIVNDEKRAE
jgi:MarR family transcriptional regulator, organic hydroperoxide resistance regulator